MRKLIKKEYLLLVLIILIGAFLRFYNLMWGDGFFFHPDENNMAAAITRLDCKPMLSSILNCNLNPHFFAYGQLPLYLAYFSSFLTKFFSPILEGQSFQGLSFFAQAIFFLRFYSAFFGTLTILLVYKVTRLIVNQQNAGIFALLAAIFAAFTPGLIQNSHFGTTESLLTFFFMLILYLSLKLIEKGKKASAGNIIFLGIICGTALAVKLTAGYFIPTAFLAILISLKRQKTYLLKYLKFSFLFFIFHFSFFIPLSPYNLISFNEFRGSMNYESSVAAGSVKVFYTKQFENTTPVLFQLEKIFPYALGWPIFILGSLGLLLITIQLSYEFLSRVIRKYQISNIKYQNYKEKFKNFNMSFFIFIFSFLIYLIPNGFLFAKWTRFMAPVFPFFAVFASYFLHTGYYLPTKKSALERILVHLASLLRDWTLNLILFIPHLFNSVKTQNLTRWRVEMPRVEPGRLGLRVQSSKPAIPTPTYIISIFLIFLSILTGLSFFSIYTHPDSRIQASWWIYQNIPSGSYVLSETANVVDIPISIINDGTMEQWNNGIVISFDFYHLDQEPELPGQLIDHLEKADYIFVPSRRIFANHMHLPEKYPMVNNYYQALLNGRLGFEHTATISYRGCEKCPFQGIEKSRNNFTVLKNCLKNSLISSCLSRQAQQSASGFERSEEGEFINEQIFVSEPFTLIGDESAEETWSVFDHPIIRIYKKTKPYDKNYYQTILTDTTLI